MNKYNDVFSKLSVFLHSEDILYENLKVENLNNIMRTIKSNSHDQQFISEFYAKYHRAEILRIKDILLTMECVIEKNSVVSYLDGNTSIIDEKIDRCTPDMLSEIEKFEINNKSHILFVGTGAMPLSVAILKQHYNCKVTCLDIDNEALFLAQKWLSILGCNENIIYNNKDIFEITNFNIYTHIFITGHIDNKNALLRNMSVHIKDQKILVRNSTGLYNQIYDTLTAAEGYMIENMINHGNNMPYISLILRKFSVNESTPTPTYYFNLKTVKDNYNELRQELSACDKVFYALKANGENAIVQFLQQQHIPFEISSLGEFDIIKNLNQNSEFICSLPIKSPEMIQTLYDNGCRYFVFDAWKEYQKLRKLAPLALKIVRINITDISPTAISYGMTENDFLSEYKVEYSDIAGVTFYNSPNSSTQQILKILERCTQILHRIVSSTLILNIGGNYRFATDIDTDFYICLQQRLHELKEEFHNLIIYAEPGRTVVKSAGYIVSKVIFVQRHEETYDIFLDAGLPTGILYPPTKVSLLSPINFPQAHSANCNFYGITCSKKLLFSKKLPYIPMENNLLVLEEMGSYSLCKANHFHGWDMPSIIYKY